MTYFKDLVEKLTVRFAIFNDFSSYISLVHLKTLMIYLKLLDFFNALNAIVSSIQIPEKTGSV